VRKEVPAEDAANMAFDVLEIKKVGHEHLLAGDGMGTGFEKVESSEGGGPTLCLDRIEQQRKQYANIK
jgi:hypothetical protein